MPAAHRGQRLDLICSETVNREAAMGRRCVRSQNPVLHQETLALQTVAVFVSLYSGLENQVFINSI